jgi:multidrug transporter EmrE-like cation transporter
VGASVLLKITALRGGLPSLRFISDLQGGALLSLGLALGCYGLAFIAYMLTLRSIPVSVAYPLITGLTTLAIALIAPPLFGEMLGWKGTLGIVLVLAGGALLTSTASA